MKTKSLLLIALLSLAGCSDKSADADAFGSFEATEVILSSETSGRVVRFNPEKGIKIGMDEEIALIDTTILHLQKQEIEAGIRSVRTRIASINAQNEIINQQIGNLRVDILRIENLLKDDAATRKQYDDLTGQEAVMKKQLTANNIQKSSVTAEIEVLESKKALLDEQIRRSLIKSPLSGTLVEKYAEAGEIATPGRPLAKLADLSVMKLRVFVSGAMLGDIRLGENCTVRADKGKKEYVSFPGTIGYISEKAEFTPKIIQTKEERVTLVYAVDINVKNDGTLKSGMPGEAIFKPRGE